MKSKLIKSTKSEKNLKLSAFELAINTNVPKNKVTPEFFSRFDGWIDQLFSSPENYLRDVSENPNASVTDPRLYPKDVEMRLEYEWGEKNQFLHAQCQIGPIEHYSKVQIDLAKIRNSLYTFLGGKQGYVKAKWIDVNSLARSRRYVSKDQKDRE